MKFSSQVMLTAERAPAENMTISPFHVAAVGALNGAITLFHILTRLGGFDPRFNYFSDASH